VTLSFYTVIDCPSLGIYAVILLSLLSLSVKMTVSDRPGLGGPRYVRHVDNTNADGRRLTAIFYLNPAWPAADGGCIRVFIRLGRIVALYHRSSTSYRIC
jgi:hypothetical protein